MSFQVQHANLIDIQPRTIEFAPDSDIRNATASIAGISPGHIEITVIAEPAGVVRYATQNLSLTICLQNQEYIRGTTPPPSTISITTKFNAILSI